eukprot:2708472-Rhodomonas_salina.1
MSLRTRSCDRQGASESERAREREGGRQTDSGRPRGTDRDRQTDRRQRQRPPGSAQAQSTQRTPPASRLRHACITPESRLRHA